MEGFHRGTTFPLIIIKDLDLPSTLHLFTIFVHEKLSETEISMTLWEQGKVLLAGISMHIWPQNRPSWQQLEDHYAGPRDTPDCRWLLPKVRNNSAQEGSVQGRAAHLVLGRGDRPGGVKHAGLRCDRGVGPSRERFFLRHFHCRQMLTRFSAEKSMGKELS